MKILYIAHRIPYPPNKGDKIRSFHQLRHLASRGRVYLAALVDDHEDMRHQEKLEEICAEVHLVPFAPLPRKIRAFSGLLSGLPLTVSYFYDKRLQSAVNSLLTRHDFAAIFCFSVQMGQYLRPALTAPKPRPLAILDCCDVDSEKWRKYGERATPLSSWLYRREAKLLADYERQMATIFDHALFATDHERLLFAGNNPDLHNLVTVGNGIDLDYFRPPTTPDGDFPPAAPVLTFVGAMDYPPNIDGVCWFAAEIWPRIKKQFPRAAFTVVGMHPTSAIRRLGRLDSSILVTGTVEDVRPYYRQASVVIVPLRIARGIQNKVLEAMAMQKAIVTTPEAFAGIDARPDTDLIVCDRNNFAAELLALLKDDGRRRNLAFSARRQVEKVYHWNTRLAGLDTLLKPRQPKA